MNKRYETTRLLIDYLKHNDINSIIELINSKKIKKVDKAFSNNVALEGNVSIFKYLFHHDLIKKDDKMMHHHLLIATKNLSLHGDQLASFILKNIQNIHVEKIFKYCISTNDFNALDYFEGKFNYKIKNEKKIIMSIENGNLDLFFKYEKTVKMTLALKKQIAKKSLKYEKIHILTHSVKNYNFTNKFIFELTKTACKNKSKQIFIYLYDFIEIEDKLNYFTKLSFNYHFFLIFIDLFRDPFKIKDENILYFKKQIIEMEKEYEFNPIIKRIVFNAAKLSQTKLNIKDF